MTKNLTKLVFFDGFPDVLRQHGCGGPVSTCEAGTPSGSEAANMELVLQHRGDREVTSETVILATQKPFHWQLIIVDLEMISVLKTDVGQFLVHFIQTVIQLSAICVSMINAMQENRPKNLF